MNVLQPRALIKTHNCSSPLNSIRARAFALFVDVGSLVLPDGMFFVYLFIALLLLLVFLLVLERTLTSNIHHCTLTYSDFPTTCLYKPVFPLFMSRHEIVRVSPVNEIEQNLLVRKAALCSLLMFTDAPLHNLCKGVC